ncbi:hypothetical protein CR969_02455 [Candidatus Saccharibacteria bacterium]|nr:MAG: hypothetical protein CR969_02455 [Candidatus Saccharibacteria bacterium]
MISKLYAAYDLPIDHDTCHLFEHVVNRHFLKRLQQYGHHRGFFGRLNGQTIESTVFFDISVHDKPTIELFEDSLKQIIDSKDEDVSLLIDECLLHIGAEMLCHIELKDRDQLMQHIKNLARYFAPMETKGAAVNSEPALITAYSPHQFTGLEVDIVTDCPSKQLMQAWFAMRSQICDIVHDCALDPLPIYLNETLGNWTENEQSTTSLRYTINKNADLTNLEHRINQALQAFQASDYTADIKKYQHDFQTDNWFVNSPIGLYELFGIEATREEIADSITPDNLDTLLQGSRVKISKT